MVHRLRIASLLLGLTLPGLAHAEMISNPSPGQIELLYRFLSGEEPDYDRLARNSQRVRNASEFDRANILGAEIARLKNDYQRMREVNEVVLNVSGQFSEYDSTKGGFNLDLFQPNTFIPFDGFNVLFDNYDEFSTWKLDVNAARAALAQNRNSRGITYRVHFRPFAAQNTGNRFVRAQATKVELINDQTRTTLASLATSRPLRQAQQPGGAQAAALDPAKQEVMGLKIGVTQKGYDDWLASRKFVGERLYLSRTSEKVGRGMFASSKDAYGALGGGEPARYGALAGRQDREESTYSEFAIGGDRLDCKSKGQLDSICGEVSFRPDQKGEPTLVAVRVLQSIAARTMQPVMADVVTKYGNFSDSFDVRIHGMNGRQFVWGAPMPVNWERDGLFDMTEQRKAWQLTVIAVQAEANRVALIIQVGGSPAGTTPTSATVERPRL